MNPRTVFRFVVVAVLSVVSVGSVFAKGGFTKELPAEPPTVTSIIQKYGLSQDFPSKVLEEAVQIPAQIPKTELKNRRDLRDRTIVTIDGEDTRDFDDAVSVMRKENGNILLGVHIADVGYYVKEDSELDKEAYQRGTSVYFPDRVLPMLPTRLSNGVCSLNPQEDRLTLTCDMEINSQGEFVRYELYPSVIKSRERMTYNQVSRILEGRDTELMNQYQALIVDFKLMDELRGILYTKREKQGCINFKSDEIKMSEDESGKIKIEEHSSTVAHHIIEEFMLAANEVVATHCSTQNIPSVYRVHGNPNPQKWKSLCGLMKQFGYTIESNPEEVTSLEIQKVLQTVEGKSEEALIHKVMLRSMSKAVYSPECTGHFSLATQNYTHFTSPIRRYPDLLVHRAIRESIEKGAMTEERREELESFLKDAAKKSSDCERTANQEEREVKDLKMMEYMKDKVGNEFNGIINGLKRSGFYVQLPNRVEGFISVKSLTDDTYGYKHSKFAFIGKNTGKRYRLGDKVRIKAEEVNLIQGKLIFSLVHENNANKKREQVA